MSQELSTASPWTTARVGLERKGNSISTREQLKLKWDHAAAKDAVQSVWDWQLTQSELHAMQRPTLRVSSQINTRLDFLKRPDLGRKLNPNEIPSLQALSQTEDLKPWDLAITLSDGLSALAIHRHGVAFLQQFFSTLQQPLRIAPLVLAPYSRVALSDEVGYHLKARLSVILIGERPGLSSPDSLGIYLTYAPLPGTQDSSRNCISNIRPPHGLSYEAAAHKLTYLVQQSLARQLSGVQLKDQSTQPFQRLSEEFQTPQTPPLVMEPKATPHSV
ncbi:MAG: ethanolamine ammonia-lyase subunit EutC [Bdellovibrionia bacterium]